MKIYTKQGDKGQTALFGGDRVSKHSIRIETYGTVDELNSILGVAIANEHQAFTGEVINDVQHQLFILGADLLPPFSFRRSYRSNLRPRSAVSGTKN